MELKFLFGTKNKKDFIQRANRRSRLKGTVGTFGKWCRSKRLAVDGKVTLKCINAAKRSGNNLLIKRATYAKNIGGYLGARHKRKSTRFGRPRFVKSIPRNRVAGSVMGPVKRITFKNKRVSKYNFNFSPQEMEYINNRRNFLEREIKFLETVNLSTLQNTLNVLKTTTPKEVLNNDVRTRINMKLYAAIIDHKLDIEEGEEVSSYPSSGDNKFKLFTLRVKKIRTSRFGDIGNPANYYHLIGEYNNELKQSVRQGVRRHDRYPYYEQMLKNMYRQRALPIYYLIDNLNLIPGNTLRNKVRRYVLIRLILKIIRQNINQQEASRIANTPRESLPTNLRRFRNNFGKTRFGNYADEYIHDLIEEEKEIIIPKVENELKIAEKIIDSYPKNNTLKRRATNLIINIKKKLVRLVTIENGKTFVNNLIGLLKTLTALLGAMYLLYEGYNALYERSAVFRGITTPIEFLLNKVRKQHESNTENIVNFTNNIKDQDDYYLPQRNHYFPSHPQSVTNYNLRI